MKMFAKIAFALVLGVVSIPAVSIVAPVTMTEAQACGTGGSASRGISCHQHYLNSCSQLGRNNPWCLNNGGRGGYYGRPIVQRPVYHGHHPVRRPVPAYAANGHYYRSGAVYGSSSALVIPRAQHARPAAPPPSPEQVARMAKHTVERVPVDCAGGYSRVEGSNRCARITWVPGED